MDACTQNSKINAIQYIYIWMQVKTCGLAGSDRWSSQNLVNASISFCFLAVIIGAGPDATEPVTGTPRSLPTAFFGTTVVLIPRLL